MLQYVAPADFPTPGHRSAASRISGGAFGGTPSRRRQCFKIDAVPPPSPVGVPPGRREIPWTRPCRALGSAPGTGHRMQTRKRAAGSGEAGDIPNDNGEDDMDQRRRGLAETGRRRRGWRAGGRSRRRPGAGAQGGDRGQSPPLSRQVGLRVATCRLVREGVPALAVATTTAACSTSAPSRSASIAASSTLRRTRCSPSSPAAIASRPAKMLADKAGPALPVRCMSARCNCCRQSRAPTATSPASAGTTWIGTSRKAAKPAPTRAS